MSDPSQRLNGACSIIISTISSMEKLTYSVSLGDGRLSPYIQMPMLGSYARIALGSRTLRAHGCVAWSRTPGGHRFLLMHAFVVCGCYLSMIMARAHELSRLPVACSLSARMCVITYNRCSSRSWPLQYFWESALDHENRQEPIFKLMDNLMMAISVRLLQSIGMPSNRNRCLI